MAETERLKTTAEIYFVNGTSLEIDIYVNGEAQASISDPASFTVGQTFVVTGDEKTPFQVYSFTVRYKDAPDGEVLAAASIPMELGRSFTGVFHWRPDGGWQLSIYENDLSRGTEGRLTVRNTSSLAQLNWRIVPNGENPDVPVDGRSGVLGHAEWQIARSVELNDYLFEAFAGDQLVTREEDLDIGLEQNLIVHVVGAPRPTADNSLWEQVLVIQELEFDPGPAVADWISDPAPPLSTSDSNQALEFDCGPASFYETRGGRIQVSATDPDGYLLNLRVADVIPKVDGFVIEDDAFSASPELGAAGTASVSVDPGVPAGQYQVVLAANQATLAQQGHCSVDVRIQPITVPRLSGLVAAYAGQPSIGPDFAQELDALLARAGQALVDGNPNETCRTLERVITRISDAECPEINPAAVDALTRETEALRKDLECG